MSIVGFVSGSTGSDASTGVSLASPLIEWFSFLIEGSGGMSPSSVLIASTDASACTSAVFTSSNWPSFSMRTLS